MRGDAEVRALVEGARTVLVPFVVVAELRAGFAVGARGGCVWGLRRVKPVGAGPLILDTGGWLFALAVDEAYANALKDARPAIVPGLVLAEVDWHLRKRREDVERAAEVDRKFADLGLGIVDASIVALAGGQTGFAKALSMSSWLR